MNSKTSLRSGFQVLARWVACALGLWLYCIVQAYMDKPASAPTFDCASASVEHGAATRLASLRTMCPSRARPSIQLANWNCDNAVTRTDCRTEG